MTDANPASPAVLAFDLGGTRIKAGLVRAGAVRALTTAPTDERGGAEGVLAAIEQLSGRLLEGRAADAVGIAVKGIVDPEGGVLLDVNDSLKSLIGQPIGPLIAARLGFPTHVENDARMYALGEFAHGAGRGCRNMVCLTLGTGIGCGVVLGGRVLRGARGVGGVLSGHLTLDVEGEPCTCGSIGCLETLIGTRGIIRQAVRQLAMGRPSALSGVQLDPQRIFDAAAGGDALATDVVQHFVKHLAAGIVTMIHAYDPDVVVLGGGLMHGLGPYLAAVQSYVDAHAWTIPRGRVRVVPAALGDAAALVGVAELAGQADIFM